MLALPLLITLATRESESATLTEKQATLLAFARERHYELVIIEQSFAHLTQLNDGGDDDHAQLVGD